MFCSQAVFVPYDPPVNRVAVGVKALDGQHVQINDSSTAMTLVYDEALGGGEVAIGFGVHALQHAYFTNGAKYPSDDDDINSMLANPFWFRVFVPQPVTKLVLEYCATAPTDVAGKLDDELLVGTVVQYHQPIKRLCCTNIFANKFVTVIVRSIEGGRLVTKDTKIEHVPGLFVRLVAEDSDDE